MLNILTAYNELKNLNNGFVYSIAQINWWLLKYGDLYKNIDTNQDKPCDTCLDMEAENLPYDCFSKPNYCNKVPELKSFIKFYDELDKATQYHKLEQKCSIAFEEYLSFKDGDLKGWMIKHYETFYKVSGDFYRYLEFNSRNDKDLHIAEDPTKSFGIAVREEDFKNSLTFYHIYYDLYYNQKLYPEKIKEWDEFFSKIKIPKEYL